MSDTADQMAIVRRMKGEINNLQEENERLKGGDGGGTSGGMEARIAVLEADMKHVKEQLGKLSAVPSDLATLKERTSHLPTKAEMTTAITDIVDKAAGRTQRAVGLVGTLVAIAVAAINWVPKLLNVG